MHGGDRSVLRDAALFLDRYRGAIEAEVDRRMDRASPAPEVRSEVVRRFRTFCRLASLRLDGAQPSLEGLGGNSAAAIERTVTTAVDVACLCGAPQEVARALRDLEVRFRSGVRRTMRPEEEEPGPRRRRSPEARRRVRAAIDRIGDAYLALCLETGRVFDLNPAAESLLGDDASKLLERSFAELVGPGDREVYRSLEARLDAGEETGPACLTITRQNGDPIPVTFSISSHTIAGRRLAILVGRERASDAGGAGGEAYSTRSR